MSKRQVKIWLMGGSGPTIKRSSLPENLNKKCDGAHLESREYRRKLAEDILALDGAGG